MIHSFTRATHKESDELSRICLIVFFTKLVFVGGTKEISAISSRSSAHPTRKTLFLSWRIAGAHAVTEGANRKVCKKKSKEEESKNRQMATHQWRHANYSQRVSLQEKAILRSPPEFKPRTRLRLILHANFIKNRTRHVCDILIISCPFFASRRSNSTFESADPSLEGVYTEKSAFRRIAWPAKNWARKNNEGTPLSRHGVEKKEKKNNRPTTAHSFKAEMHRQRDRRVLCYSMILRENSLLHPAPINFFLLFVGVAEKMIRFNHHDVFQRNLE